MAHIDLGGDLKRSPKQHLLDRGQQRWWGRRSWWGTASGRPQKSILTKLCLCTSPSTTHWTLLKSCLVSASLWRSLYACCPAAFPERISVTTRDAPQLVAPKGSACDAVVVNIFRNKCQGCNPPAHFHRGTRWSHWYGPGRPGRRRPRRRRP